MSTYYNQGQSNSGLPTAFERFRQALELTEAQRGEISRSHVYLRDSVLKRLNYVTDAILMGSYKRKTMIRPPQDVDIFVVISVSSYSYNSPNTVLGQLKRDLRSSYPNTDMRNDRPCLVLDFNKVTYDLTPAIPSGTILGTHYKIPSQSGDTWQAAQDPNELATKLQNANYRLSQKLVPLVKMMKRCRDFNKLSIRSFQIEEIAIQNIRSIQSYRDGVQQMLRLLDWKKPNQSHYDVEYMDDIRFAQFARNDLFGTDFPRI